MRVLLFGNVLKHAEARDIFLYIEEHVAYNVCNSFG